MGRHLRQPDWPTTNSVLNWRRPTTTFPTSRPWPPTPSQQSATTGRVRFHQGMMTELAAHFGFTVHFDSGVPDSLQSVSDLRNGRIYVPQRDTIADPGGPHGRVANPRAFRSWPSRAGRISEHSFETVWKPNYFARAVLIPEHAAVQVVSRAKADFDLSIEDLKELFYVSYSMAAHRFANLITHHLDIPIHYVRADVARHDMEGVGERRLQAAGGRRRDCDRPTPLPHTSAVVRCSSLTTGTRFTTTSWVPPPVPISRSAHVLVDDRDHSVTIGTPFDSSRWFRGHTTSAETTSLCPNGACCAADPSLSAKWSSNMYASVHEQPQILAVSPAGTFPGIDPVATFEFLESRTEG